MTRAELLARRRAIEEELNRPNVLHSELLRIDVALAELDFDDVPIEYVFDHIADRAYVGTVIVKHRSGTYSRHQRPLAVNVAEDMAASYEGGKEYIVTGDEADALRAAGFSVRTQKPPMAGLGR